jgi:hypothetical protein
VLRRLQDTTAQIRVRRRVAVAFDELAVAI